MYTAPPFFNEVLCWSCLPARFVTASGRAAKAQGGSPKQGQNGQGAAEDPSWLGIPHGQHEHIWSTSLGSLKLPNDTSIQSQYSHNTVTIQSQYSQYILWLKWPSWFGLMPLSSNCFIDETLFVWWQTLPTGASNFGIALWTRGTSGRRSCGYVVHLSNMTMISEINDSRIPDVSCSTSTDVLYNLGMIFELPWYFDGSWEIVIWSQLCNQNFLWIWDSGRKKRWEMVGRNGNPHSSESRRQWPREKSTAMAQVGVGEKKDVKRCEKCPSKLRYVSLLSLLQHCRSK